MVKGNYFAPIEILVFQIILLIIHSVVLHLINLRTFSHFKYASQRQELPCIPHVWF